MKSNLCEYFINGFECNDEVKFTSDTDQKSHNVIFFFLATNEYLKYSQDNSS